MALNENICLFFDLNDAASLNCNLETFAALERKFVGISSFLLSFVYFGRLQNINDND